jgi:hypothetical protein
MSDTDAQTAEGNPGAEPIRLHRVGDGDPASAVNVRYRPGA